MNERDLRMGEWNKEQSKAMEYESQKESLYVLKLRDMYMDQHNNVVVVVMQL
jgi:hypothetical protein